MSSFSSIKSERYLFNRFLSYISSSEGWKSNTHKPQGRPISNRSYQQSVQYYTFEKRYLALFQFSLFVKMKCPQLSKPEATAARNQNSIGDRMEKKTLRETRLSRRASSPLTRRTSSLCRGLIWFPRSCPDGCLGDGVLTGGLSLGLI